MAGKLLLANFILVTLAEGIPQVQPSQANGNYVHFPLQRVKRQVIKSEALHARGISGAFQESILNEQWAYGMQSKRRTSIKFDSVNWN
jgi:hypothetical protein